MGPVRNTAPSYPRAPSRPAGGAAPPRGWDRGGAWTLTQDGPGWGLQGGREGTRAAGGMKTGTEEVGAESRAGRSQLPWAGAGAGPVHVRAAVFLRRAAAAASEKPHGDFPARVPLTRREVAFLLGFQFLSKKRVSGQGQSGPSGLPRPGRSPASPEKAGPFPTQGAHQSPPHHPQAPHTPSGPVCGEGGVGREGCPKPESSESWPSGLLAE